jgi:hypothetical protein
VAVDELKKIASGIIDLHLVAQPVRAVLPPLSEDVDEALHL